MKPHRTPSPERSVTCRTRRHRPRTGTRLRHRKKAVARSTELQQAEERQRGADQPSPSNENQRLDEVAAAPAQARRAIAEPLLTTDGDHPLHPLALPGLQVLGVSLEEAGALSGLQIDHRLPSGDTLRLTYVGLFSQASDPRVAGVESRLEAESLPAVSAQIQEAALPAGWRQVVVRKENRWVVARAPLTEAEIRAYLMTLN